MMWPRWSKFEEEYDRGAYCLHSYSTYTQKQCSQRHLGIDTIGIRIYGVWIINIRYADDAAADNMDDLQQVVNVVRQQKFMIEEPWKE